MRINSQKDRNYLKIIQCSKDGKLIKIWNTQAEIQRELNIYQSDISKAIHGVIKTSGGFIWKFKEN